MANISYGVNFLPKTNNTYTLGNSDYKWSTIYSVNLNITDLDVANSISMDRKSSTTVGENSVALGYNNTASGAGAVAEGYTSVASGNYSHTEGGYTTASAQGAHAEGDNTTASGASSHAEGSGTIASGSVSHAEGYYTTASSGYAHAEGMYTIANISGAHAEGSTTKARGVGSHAEGIFAHASGMGSHAEGMGRSTTSNQTTTADENYGAIGTAAHAEGMETKAYGAYSHAEGWGTITNSMSAHVFGSFNAKDTAPAYDENTTYEANDVVIKDNIFMRYTGSVWSGEKGHYVEIVGNGRADQDNLRSNARVLDWSGNERLNGYLYVGCNADSSGGTRIPHDIQVNGTSIVSNGVANIPYTATGIHGLVRPGDGLYADNGQLLINSAHTDSIKAGLSNYLPITPKRQHEAVFYGLTKAAGVDMSSSSNAVGTYTNEAKAAIRTMIGATVVTVSDSLNDDSTTNALSAAKGKLLSEQYSSFATLFPTLVAISENSTTATSAITTGQYVVWQGQLKKAISNISIGDTLSSSNLTNISGGVANELAKLATTSDAGLMSSTDKTKLDNITTQMPITYESSTRTLKFDIVGGSSLEAQMNSLNTNNTNLKNAIEALMALANHVAYTDTNGTNYINAVGNALYPGLVSISATLTLGNNLIHESNTLNDLKQYLTVTASYDNGTTATLNNTDYNLSGTIAASNSSGVSNQTFTIVYCGKTTTISANVYNNMTLNKVTLPAGYTQVAMIYQNTNNDGYIDTNINGNTPARVVYGCQVCSGASNGTNWHAVSSNIHYYPYFRQGNSGARNIQAAYKTTIATGLSTTWEPDTNYEFDTTFPVVTINGTIQETVTAGTYSTDNTLYIFAHHGTQNTADYCGMIRLYYLKMYNDQDELIHNFIPCTDSSNNVGLYDTIEENFITNTTYPLLAGGAVV